MVPSRYLVYSNEAFEKLPEGTVDDLLNPENKEKLITILKHRVISNVLKGNQHVSKPKSTTANGGDILFSVGNGSSVVGDAKIRATDITSSNGIMHAVDTVLIPQIFASLDHCQKKQSDHWTDVLAAVLL